jgi:hypothetical protein
MTVNKAYENRVRKLAAKHGCIVRRREPGRVPLDNLFVGDFMLLDNRDRQLMGDATLDQIEYYLGER